MEVEEWLLNPLKHFAIIIVDKQTNDDLVKMSSTQVDDKITKV